MRHWLQIATRNWRTKPARAALSVLAITLGVGVVVWVTCCYESVRRSVTDLVLDWIGRAHVIVEPVEGVWAVFDEGVEQKIAALPGIRATTIRTREYVEASTAVQKEPHRIEVTGLVPAREQIFRAYKISQGRFLEPNDHGKVLMEEVLAHDMGLRLGDNVLLRDPDQEKPPVPFAIVGLVDRRRASLNQAPMVWTVLKDVQELCRLPGTIKAVDIMLADATPETIRAAADKIREVVASAKLQNPDGPHSKKLEVKTTQAQHQKLGAAQSLLQFIMMLLSCVVLLTALFIILATMSMGITEQISELGLMRCVGMTRGQVIALIISQTAPLGIIGTALGVPLGLALQWLTIQAAPEYLGHFVINPAGLTLAIVGGIGTTLLGAAIPAMRAFYLSPTHAVRPYAAVRRLHWVWFSAAIGVLTLVAHQFLLARTTIEKGTQSFDTLAIVILLLLYGGCFLIAPAIIVIIGRAVVAIVARIVGLRSQLLGEELDRAPFRTASICGGLMVGLSLIVGLIVWGESIKQGWQFPKEFPDALLYSYEPLPLDKVRALRDTQGITGFTVADDFGFTLSKPKKKGFFSSFSILEDASRFLAVEVDRGLALVKLTFVEGNEAEARAKLKSGGHLLITREFAQARSKHLGDTLNIWVGETKAKFTIAGVVASPGLDIAISFFNASEYFQFYAVGAVIGTLEDADRLFDRRYGKLMLFNFNLAAAPGESSNRAASRVAKLKRYTAPSGRPTMALGPGPIPGDGPQERVVNEMLARLNDPPKAFVTARELKDQIDASITRVTLLLSAIPLVGLIVSALGLANLMAANVASRSRQLAVLRAIGVTRGQVMRMVIGEALVVGVLGSLLGMGLGLLVAQTSNFMTQKLSGFAPEWSLPWGLIFAGVGLATLLCLLAAMIPARRASRSNIVAALSGA
jgi:putative ABC transport system permease protein